VIPLPAIERIEDPTCGTNGLPGNGAAELCYANPREPW
jgi:hypothetical protein